jgi:hypothetical protein
LYVQYCSNATTLCTLLTTPLFIFSTKYQTAGRVNEETFKVSNCLEIYGEVKRVFLSMEWRGPWCLFDDMGAMGG